MGKQRVRITNISEGHIGFSRPSSLFLRRPKDSGPSNLASAVIFEDQVDEKMREMVVNKLITINSFEEVDQVGEAVRKARKKIEPKVEMTVTADRTEKVDIVGQNVVVTVDKPNKEIKNVSITDTATRSSDSVLLKVEDPTSKVEAKTEDLPKTKIINPTPTAQVATVGSSESGGPVVKDPGPAAPSTVTASKEEMGMVNSGVYSISDLVGMKMSDVRGIVADLGINVKSVKKEDLITAVLKKQGNEPKE